MSQSRPHLNCAARLLATLQKLPHISVYTKDSLYWVPAEERGEFKISSWMGGGASYNVTDQSHPTYIYKDALCSNLESTGSAIVVSSIRGDM